MLFEIKKAEIFLDPTDCRCIESVIWSWLFRVGGGVFLLRIDEPKREICFHSLRWWRWALFRLKLLDFFGCKPLFPEKEMLECLNALNRIIYSMDRFLLFLYSVWSGSAKSLIRLRVSITFFTIGIRQDPVINFWITDNHW